MPTNQQVIDQTKKWITDIVIGCNFCPFAAHVVKQGSIHYQVEKATTFDSAIAAFIKEMTRLDDDAGVETVFLIFPNSFKEFDDYLDLVALAEKALLKNGYEGIYQVASFHPVHTFADAVKEDAADYTNRSVYPMLHLLREASIDAALQNYKNPEQIPERNIDFARKKGVTYMKMLRDACMNA
jgi:uncharacterized protein